MGRPLLLAALIALGAPLAARAQVEGALPSAPVGPRRLAPAVPLPQEAVSPWLATASSAVAPGLGQLLMGQRRWTIYAGIELAGWILHLDRARKGGRWRDGYRDLAWATARGMPQPRDDGDWEYYEALSSWPRSGAFDGDARQTGIQPETDPDSYNGAVWGLARDLYLPEGAGPEHPAWGRALEYYGSRAIGPAFLWDWRGREESLQRYRDLIDRSDQALRTATVALGGVVANHLFAAVDAFVSSRLGGTPPVSGSVGWRPAPGGISTEWRVEVRP